MNEDTFKLMQLRGKGHNSLLHDLDLYINDLKDNNKKLNEKLDNFNKDDEIKKLQDEIDSLRVNSMHIMSDSEKLNAKDFGDSHFKSCKSNIDYILTGTGIGTAVTVKCKKCNVEKNITDYSNW